MTNFSEKVSLIRNIANLLRWGRKAHEYQDVIFPLVVLKRLDSVLEKTKPQVLKKYNEYKSKLNDLDPLLKSTAGYEFYNTSVYNFKSLLDDPSNIAKNLQNYISWFSQNMLDIIERFKFEDQLKKLKSGDLLYLIMKEFNKVNLSLDDVSNHDMWYIFEELIRKFSEMSNETAWEHYTPREVIQLMVNVLLEPDKEILKKPYIIRTVYDPACGTGGMLTTAKDAIVEQINEQADVQLFGQELNPVTYAVCKSDMLIKWENADNIKWWEDDHSKASTLSNDQLKWLHFDYILSNPPYWVEWKKDKVVVDEEAERWFAGRFGAGTPRISDGQLLFLQHMISKMKRVEDGGSRVAVVFNGSPLFTWDAGGGESEIRRWILENDLLEAIIGLPDQLFYNTWISTYIRVLTNRKTKETKGNVKLIDARNFYKKMRKSLGNKRHEISPEDINKIAELLLQSKDWELVKIFKTTDFAYRQITIERPIKLQLTLNERIFDEVKNINTDFVKKEDFKKTVNIIDLFINFVWDFVFILPQTTTFLWQKQMKDMFKIYKQKTLEATGEIEIKESNKDDQLIDSLIYALFERHGEKHQDAEIFLDKKWNPKSDWDLRDSENVPYHMDINEYFDKEVKPFVPDAWINTDTKYCDIKDGKVGKVGYEINFTRYFYTYEAPRSLEDIETDILTVEKQLLDLVHKITE